MPKEEKLNGESGCSPNQKYLAAEDVALFKRR